MPRKAKQLQAIRKDVESVTGQAKSRILSLISELATTEGRTKKGRAIRDEIAAVKAEYERDRLRIEAAMAARDDIATSVLASLGRTPNGLDIIAAKTIADLSISVDRFEAAENYEKATEARRLLLQATRAFGVKPQPASKPAGPNVYDLLEEVARDHEARS